jgi:hypothetical protein
MDARQDRMDGNITGLRRDVTDLKQGLGAIMRHLGVEQAGE